LYRETSQTRFAEALEESRATGLARMTSIVFINPPLSLRDRYGDMARSGTRTPPLGLAQLAAVTRREGHASHIIDCPAQGWDDEQTIQCLRELKPRYVGITAVTIGIYSAGRLATAIKQLDPSICVLIGGPHVTAVPERTMQMFPDFEAAVLGEGEITLVEFLKARETGQALSEVRGLLIRDGDTLTRTPPRPFIEDLDSLPLPAWDLLPDLARSYDTPTFTLGKPPASSLLTSRGCCGHCLFCDRSVFGNACRFHSAERVFACMKLLHERFGINDIIIHDDAFVINHKRVEAVCNLLLESRLGVTWGCNARVNLVNPELLRLMRKAGCWQIGYGIETGSPRILNVINKGVTIEQIKQAVCYTHEAGIRTRGFFMLGHPGETEETIRETIALATSIPIDDFQITFFTPLPGAEIYDTARQFGTFDDDWRKLNMWRPVFIPNGLTEAQLIDWHKRAFRSFYFRPRTVWNYLKVVRDPRHVMKLARGALTLAQTTIRPRTRRRETTP